MCTLSAYSGRDPTPGPSASSFLGAIMRIVIDTTDHPHPSRLLLQLEAVVSLHDPDPSLTVLSDPEPA